MMTTVHEYFDRLSTSMHEFTNGCSFIRVFASLFVDGSFPWPAVVAADRAEYFVWPGPVSPWYHVGLTHRVLRKALPQCVKIRPRVSDPKGFLGNRWTCPASWLRKTWRWFAGETLRVSLHSCKSAQADSVVSPLDFNGLNKGFIPALASRASAHSGKTPAEGMDDND